ncbi:Hypothetical predicted protein [Paramuricea clavata]|uniref:Uncharacterized protein n=1 Tax=Paramuricea clavata TaxID=317549 RepID=A0A7D9LKP9_PARCT|nr:Hypothetical predicted protein [Paramuricea clavata]
MLASINAKIIFAQLALPCFAISTWANLAMVKSRKPVPVKTSLYMRYLFQEKGVRGSQLLQAFPKYSKATVYRHVKLPIDDCERHDKRKYNKGRPRKLTVREERNLVRELRKLRATIGSFSASRLRTAAGIHLLRFHSGPFEEALKVTELEDYCPITSGNAVSASTLMRRLSFTKPILLIRHELANQWHGEKEVKAVLLLIAQVKEKKPVWKEKRHISSCLSRMEKE